MSLLAKEVNRINIGTLLVLLTQATGLVVMVLPWLLSYLGLSYQVCKIWIFLWECGYSLGLERWSGEWRAGIAFIGKDKWKFVIDSDIPNLQMKTWYSSKMWQAKWPRWRDELNKRPRSIHCMEWTIKRLELPRNWSLHLSLREKTTSSSRFPPVSLL